MPRPPWQAGVIVAIAFVFTAGAPAPAFAYSPSSSVGASVRYHPVAKRSAAARSAAATASRAIASPLVVSSTSEGQAGYIHYFVITGPDGEPESQVGLELPGGRIAWSFPELGVAISPFISQGSISVDGKEYQVEHLYGVRPLRSAEAMHRLQRDLMDRVEWWLSAKTRYCDEQTPSGQFCVSCLGFVLRVLYPGGSPEVAVLPADFKSARKGMYTTEDLLLYLAGVRLELPRQARLRQIAALKVPPAMRDELARITRGNQSADAAETAGAAPPPPVAKPRSTDRSVAHDPKRAPARKRT